MAGRGEQNWISNGMAIGLVGVSIAAMLVFLALSAYAPQLRTETGGRANVLSKSAIGFAGLRVLLEEEKLPVWVNRQRQREADDDGLYVLTPDVDAAGQQLAQLAAGPNPVLIILPKWPAIPSPFHAGWVVKLDAYKADLVTPLLKSLDDTSAVWQVRPPEEKKPEAKKAADKTSGGKNLKPAAAPKKDWKAPPVAIRGTLGFGASPFPKALAIDTFQTITGKKWVADLTDGQGHAVLAHLKGTKLYLLSDPDLANTAALKNEAIAGGIIDVIKRLPGSDYVSFDVTLAGLDTPPSLLHAIFSPPLLAATLCALLAALMLALRAINRFGTPPAEEREFAFGKKSLADNTAGLIRVMGRGPGMAPRYAQAVRRSAGKILRRGKTEDVEWLDALERAGRISPSYGELLREAGEVTTQTQLMKLAARLQDWKSQITHARSHRETMR